MAQAKRHSASRNAPPSAVPAAGAEADLTAALALRRLAQLAITLQGRFMRMAQPFEIPSTAALHILEQLLDADGPLSPSALSRATGVTPGAMSQTLQTLERRELIERRAEREDRRKVSVELTPLGRRRTRAGRVAARRLASDLCADLSSRQLTELIDLVAVLQRAAETDD